MKSPNFWTEPFNPITANSSLCLCDELFSALDEMTGQRLLFASQI